MFFAVTEWNGAYAFVVPERQLRLSHFVVGRYETFKAAFRVAHVYNGWQRRLRTGLVEILQADAVARRRWEIEALRPGGQQLRMLGFSTYVPGGYFDVSPIYRPADRDSWRDATRATA